MLDLKIKYLSINICTLYESQVGWVEGRNPTDILAPEFCLPLINEVCAKTYGFMVRYL